MQLAVLNQSDELLYILFNFSKGRSLLFLACTRLKGLLRYIPCYKTLIVWNKSACAKISPGRGWGFRSTLRLLTLRQQRKVVCESCVSIHDGGYSMIRRMPSMPLS